MALLSLWNFLLTPWPSSDSKVAVSGSRYLRRVCVCVWREGRGRRGEKCD